MAGSKESKLGKIPSAAGADSAARADAAKAADTATSAGNAGTLDGIDSTSFLRSTSPEAFHELGAVGEPAFGATWINGRDTTAGCYKDPFGVVHPERVRRTFDGAGFILTLSAGYRPATTESFPTVGLIVNNVIPVLVVASRGELELFGEQAGFNDCLLTATLSVRVPGRSTCGQPLADEMPARGGRRGRRT